MVLWFPSKNADWEGWAEHFQSHFSNCQQPQPNSHPHTLPVSVWTVSNEPPTETEVSDAIKRLKLRRAAGLGDLPPVLFKTGSATLIRFITQLFESIWQSVSPRKMGWYCCDSYFQKRTERLYVRTTEVSIWHPSSPSYSLQLFYIDWPVQGNSQIREQQAGFRPGRGRIDHIFTLRQYL